MPSTIIQVGFGADDDDELLGVGTEVEVEALDVSVLSGSGIWKTMVFSLGRAPLPAEAIFVDTMCGTNHQWNKQPDNQRRRRKGTRGQLGTWDTGQSRK